MFAAAPCIEVVIQGARRGGADAQGKRVDGRGVDLLARTRGWAASAVLPTPMPATAAASMSAQARSASHARVPGDSLGRLDAGLQERAAEGLSRGFGVAIA